MRVYTGKHGKIEYKVTVYRRRVRVVGIHRYRMEHGGEKLMSYRLSEEEKNQILRWGFWQISGWNGRWSKYHLFIDGNQTICGRDVYPEIGSEIVFREPGNGQCCKACAGYTTGSL